MPRGLDGIANPETFTVEIHDAKIPFASHTPSVLFLWN
jgi:hypothetical protein